MARYKKLERDSKYWYNTEDRNKPDSKNKKVYIRCFQEGKIKWQHQKNLEFYYKNGLGLIGVREKVEYVIKKELLAKEAVKNGKL